MPTKLLSAEDFRDAAKKDGQTPEGTVFKYATSESETVGDADSRVRRFVFSDATVDHSDDSIDPKGWQLGIFKSNPVALFSHMSWEPPIGRASNVSVKDGKLAGDIEFASADVYEFADTIFRLVNGGFLKAVSVGFKPEEWAFSSDKNRPYGIDFKKQTLLEISVCAVPCNPAALGEARSLGIDTAPLRDWAEKVLDSGDTVFLPRKDLESLRSQAGAPERRFYIEGGPALTPKFADEIKGRVKTWMDDPSEVLVLPHGAVLRTLGGDAPAVEAPETVEVPAAEEPEADVGNSPLKIADWVKRWIAEQHEAEALKEIEAVIAKAGRRISAATKAKLQAALDMSAAHHDAMTKCLGDAMGDDNGDPPDDPDEAQTDAVDTGAQPPGSVVVESTEHLTPEERRLKEVAALRAGLPKND